ncbi:MAG: helix-turn-helix domain-containing protein [Clostridia bacterium]|nr:helix-turn-helix domain-containing protein [Clostridia bacterium]
MPDQLYEKHIHDDPDFPFFFHLDTAVPKKLDKAFYHWHESVEILNCTKGDFVAVINGRRMTLKAGETLVVDPLSLHATISSGDENGYYCLIIDKSFCAEHSLVLPDGSGAGVFSDAKVNELFSYIDSERRGMEFGWKTAVSAAVLSLCVRLARLYPPSSAQRTPDPFGGSAIAQNVTRYLYENILDRFSMDALCAYMGFSRFYLCHSFREATGESIVGYLNKLRCDRAQKLIASGCNTVSEAAEKSGFSSFSYFSRVYRRIYGRSPSEDMPLKKTRTENA